MTVGRKEGMPGPRSEARVEVSSKNGEIQEMTGTELKDNWICQECFAVIPHKPTSCPCCGVCLGFRGMNGI